MKLRHKGYVFIASLSLLGSAVLALTCSWGEIKLPEIQQDDLDTSAFPMDEFAKMFAQALSGQSFPINGANGSIEMFSVSIPYWISSLCVVLGTFMLFMNTYELGDFPSVMPLALFGLAAMVVVGAATEILLSGELFPSFAFAVVGPAAGMALSVFLDRQSKQDEATNPT